VTGNENEPKAHRWGTPETLFVIWVGVALASLLPVTAFLQGSFPIFTVVWLAVPLGIVLFGRDARRVGFRPIPPRDFLTAAGVMLAVLLALSLLVEPLTHAYASLVQAAVATDQPDPTFAWLVRFDGPLGWGGLLLFSGLVTIFGEELFFRGWLLQALSGRLNGAWAVLLQAALFILPQLLAAFLLAPLQGALYALVYSLLGVGLTGGWAARRTRSIWPSLAAAVLWNLLMTAWVLRGG
jgi:membrane protease YdiL (CAAX protease family)